MGKKNNFKIKLKKSKGYKLRLFNVTLWESNYFVNAGWFRLFGIGIKWKQEKLGYLFSERNGYKKYFKVGKWVISYLPYNY